MSRPPISSSSDSGSTGFFGFSSAGALAPPVAAGALAAGAAAANFDGSFKYSLS